MRRPFDAPIEPLAFARWNYGDLIPTDELEELIEGALQSWVSRPETLEEIIDRRVFGYLCRGVEELRKEMASG